MCCLSSAWIQWTANLQRPHPWTLLYADDVTFADSKQEDLEAQVQKWYDRLGENGLTINIAKTEYLERGPQTDGTICINGQELKTTAHFKYLGSLVASYGDTIFDV